MLDLKTNINVIDIMINKINNFIQRSSENVDCSKIAKSAKSLHIVETHLFRTAQSL